MFLEKYYFIEDIETYNSNSDEECVSFLILGLEKLSTEI